MSAPTVPWDVSASTSVCACAVDVAGPERGRVVRRSYLGVGAGPVSAKGCRPVRCAGMQSRKWDGRQRPTGWDGVGQSM